MSCFSLTSERPGLPVQSQKWALLSTAGTMRFGNQPHRRGVCTGASSDWALSSMMPKAVPDAPLGARARQWYADADVDTAAADCCPNKHRYEKTAHDCPP